MRAAVAAFGAVVLAAALADRAGAVIELAPHARILEAEEVMASFVREIDGQLWVEIPGRTAWLLDASAPEATIPIDAGQVSDAWFSIHPVFRDLLAVTFVVLPAPRRELPLASAEDGLIYLSPAHLVPYTDRQVHFLVAHEMGHCLHRAVLGDAPSEWERFARHRELDAAIFYDAANHANRPREVFAEDFRFLFGGSHANYSGTIENLFLPKPDRIAGLRTYFFSLADRMSPGIAQRRGHDEPPDAVAIDAPPPHPQVPVGESPRIPSGEE